METWIFYAILSAIFAGIHNFVFKVVAERHYNTYLFTMWDYIFAAIVVFIYMLPNLLFYIVEIKSLWIITFLAFVNVLFFSLSLFTRVESMRNIDTVIFYPLYKTFGPIFVTWVSYFFFKELLEPKEFLGIIIGICVPLMLITKVENRIQKNLFLWVILVVITSVLTTISTMWVKWIQVYWLDIELFLLISFLIWIIISGGSYRLHNHKENKKKYSKDLKKMAAFAWIIHALSFLFFTMALKWNLAVVFTINSFSILIPIILSIIFYGEHFNARKGLVILLSIVSILMFL